MDVLDPKLIAKLRALEARFEELSQSLADPEVVADRAKYRDASRSYAELEPLVENFRTYRGVVEEAAGARDLMAATDDADMRQMAADEIRDLEAQVAVLATELNILLLPNDPDDSKNVVLEIRAGAGGDEATLFAEEIFSMYVRYAESRRWTIDTTDVSRSEVGGIKEVIALIEGDRVFSRMKFESGVHRVQRVPKTEAQGRIHTSAVTVAVMPEAEEVEVEIGDKELRIDTFCSSGPGGQSVNTTQSAVRITHIPTQIVVQCQDQKSWHKNKARAMQVLRSRLYDRMQREQHEARAAERKGLVGSGDRSEKIRTYNFPQSRVTDHRIGLTVHNLGEVLRGDLDVVLDALVAHDQAERLKHETGG